MNHLELDVYHERILREDPFLALDDLREALLRARRSYSRSDWRIAAKAFRQHPIASTINTSPLSRRSVEKPRGYAGDAVTLDFIYDDRPPHHLQRLPRSIFHWETSQQSCAAVRERRRFAAILIDSCASAFSKPRVMSVACGHLREADLSASISDGALGCLLALDNDARSIEHVARQHYPKVIPMCHSVASLLRKNAAPSTFHLVYAFGLYDYLEERIAQRLTQVLAYTLAPGGALVIANFGESARDAAGLECMMDWWLTYRDDQEMCRFASALPDSSFSSRVFADATGAIKYLKIRRLTEPAPSDPVSTKADLQ